MLFERIKKFLKDLIDIDEDTLFYILMAVIIVGGILLICFQVYGLAEETLRVWNES